MIICESEPTCAATVVITCPTGGTPLSGSTCSPTTQNCQSGYSCQSVNNAFMCCPVQAGGCGWPGGQFTTAGDPCKNHIGPQWSSPQVAGVPQRQTCSLPSNPCAVPNFYCVSTAEGNYCCGRQQTSTGPVKGNIVLPNNTRQFGP